MRTKLISFMLGLSLAVPALAQPNVKPNSLEATGCMKLRECTEKIFRVKDIKQLKQHFSIHWDLSVEQEQEITALLDRLYASDVDVYLADHEYFVIGNRGLYYTDVNKMFLNEFYMYSVDTFLNVLRHEGWHAAQDCMAGTIDNSFIAVIHNENVIPQEYKLMANVRYGLLQPQSIPWEQEAIWAGSQQYMTADALNACAAGSMWMEYEPTPMTREWLVKNNYIK
jgi:hypothetical protein